MIHIATVHHQSPRWVEVQHDYLRRTMSAPYRVVASMEGIDERFHRFADVVVPSLGRHAGKLNLLAQVIAEAADPDDLLVFLDGDAFPVEDPLPLIERGLASAPLTAVRRDENVGDPHPHPCFCVTTVGFWQSLPGDWSNGAPWTNAAGNQISDVGGNLRWKLERLGIEWTPILRSNVVDLHPVWFAVYGGAVYHHGAAFRRMVSRFDFADLGVERAGGGHKRLAGRIPTLGALRDEAAMRRRERESRALAVEIEAELRVDPQFYRRFLGGGGPPASGPPVDPEVGVEADQ